MFTQCPQNAPTEGVSEKTPAKPDDWREACAESARRAGVKSTPIAPRPAEMMPAQSHAKPVPGAMHESGAMNKLETKYAQHLELRRQAGEIRKWQFEPLKLRLADRTFYNVDFSVVLPDGAIELHETKGFWRDDARVKIKVAAAQFTEYNFVGVRWIRGEGWQFEAIKRRINEAGIG